MIQNTTVKRCMCYNKVQLNTQVWCQNFQFKPWGPCKSSRCKQGTLEKNKEKNCQKLRLRLLSKKGEQLYSVLPDPILYLIWSQVWLTVLETLQYHLYSYFEKGCRKKCARLCSSRTSLLLLSFSTRKHVYGQLYRLLCHSFIFLFGIASCTLSYNLSRHSCIWTRWYLPSTNNKVWVKVRPK